MIYDVLSCGVAKGTTVANIMPFGTHCFLFKKFINGTKNFVKMIGIEWYQQPTKRYPLILHDFNGRFNLSSVGYLHFWHFDSYRNHRIGRNTPQRSITNLS